MEDHGRRKELWKQTVELLGSKGIRTQNAGVPRSHKDICEELAERGGDGAAAGEERGQSREELALVGESDSLHLAGTTVEERCRLEEEAVEV